MTKTLPKDLKQAVKIPIADAKISVSVGLDGAWLHFTSDMGLHASISVPALAGSGNHGSITSAAIRQWCLDRQEQAADIHEASTVSG